MNFYLGLGLMLLILAIALTFINILKRVEILEKVIKRAHFLKKDFDYFTKGGK